MEHLSSVDEVVNFLHKIVQENRLTQAEAEVPGHKQSFLCGTASARHFFPEPSCTQCTVININFICVIFTERDSSCV